MCLTVKLVQNLLKTVFNWHVPHTNKKWDTTMIEMALVSHLVIYHNDTLCRIKKILDLISSSRLKNKNTAEKSMGVYLITVKQRR